MRHNPSNRVPTATPCPMRPMTVCPMSTREPWWITSVSVTCFKLPNSYRNSAIAGTAVPLRRATTVVLDPFLLKQHRARNPKDHWHPKILQLRLNSGRILKREIC
jgi:hypothetical protein